MRKFIEEQLKVGEIDIPEIKFDLRSRDEIPKVLIGLQAIYTDAKKRQKIVKILKEIVPSEISKTNGRPGLDLWKIFVLATIRLTCNIDYDSLQELSNQHKTIRQMLGHSILDETHYPLQTLKDNLKLFTPKIIDRINTEVVEFGQQIAGAEEGEDINAKCDSFPVPTDVHFPTDISLLFDAIRKIIVLMMKACNNFSVPGWRQGMSLLRKFKSLYRKAQKIKHSTSKDEEKKIIRQDLIKEIYSTYIAFASTLVEKAKETVPNFNTDDYKSESLVLSNNSFIVHAERQISQIHKRVLEDKKIPHCEKFFSIFEQHTEWLCKGKAGVPQVLGLNVCIVVDQYGFIISHKVMQSETDSDIAVEIIKEAKIKFPELKSCSFDKGFHSPENQKKLSEILENVYLPKKGKLSEIRKEIEYSDDFKNAMKKHSSVEASIACLINHGLDICPEHGLAGFKRYVGIAIVARNIHHLGDILQQRKLQELQKKEMKMRKLLPNNKKAS